MIKIIQLAPQSVFGGGQRIMFEIVNGLRDRFRFIMVTPAGLFLKKYSALGFPTQELKKKNLFGKIKELKNIIKREDPDIINAHGTRVAFWLRLAMIGFKDKPKIVYTLHGFHIVRRNFLIRWFLIRIERFLNQWSDILVCVSESDKNLVLKYKTIPPPKIIIIKNGIDIEKFQINEELVKAEKQRLGLTDKFVLTSVGRLHPPKDFSTVLRTLRLIISQIKNVRLLIVGDGPLRKSLEKEAKDLGLNGYVKFLGFREDIPILINLSDIIILSTRWEGLPLIPLEAGASKKPIIASNIDGVRETIVDKKTGYLFNPGSAQDLANKMLKLFSSKKLRDKVGGAGYHFISQNFNKAKMIKNYFSLYKNLIDENSSNK